MSNATIIHPDCKPAPAAPPALRISKPEPFSLVLFGATGDLAGRKLFPAMMSLMQAKYLPEQFVIIGTGRREKSDDVFREDVKRDLLEFKKNASADSIDAFLRHLISSSPTSPQLRGCNRLQIG